MNQLRLSVPMLFIEHTDTNEPIAKISYVDDGVISIDIKKDTYLDEGSIDELGLLLKEAYKELMK